MKDNSKAIRTEVTGSYWAIWAFIKENMSYGFRISKKTRGDNDLIYNEFGEKIANIRWDRKNQTNVLYIYA